MGCTGSDVFKVSCREECVPKKDELIYNIKCQVLLNELVSSLGSICLPWIADDEEYHRNEEQTVPGLSERLSVREWFCME